MFSKDLYHVSFEAKHSSTTLPTFNLGYLERTKKNLQQIVTDKNLDCRSLVVKISSDESRVFYNIDMYCMDPMIIENSMSPKLSDLFKMELGKNRLLSDFKVTSLILGTKQSSQENKFFMLILSLMFSLFVILAFPFPIFWERNK
jgi:hypothetical protein